MQRMQVRPLMASLLALLGLWMALRPLPDAAVSLLIALAGQEDISSSVLMAQFVHFFSNTLIGLSLILWREALSRWLVPQGAGVLVSPGPAWRWGQRSWVFILSLLARCCWGSFSRNSGQTLALTC